MQVKIEFLYVFAVYDRILSSIDDRLVQHSRWGGRSQVLYPIFRPPRILKVCWLDVEVTDATSYVGLTVLKP
jgi:hypothetical protein